MVYTEVNVDFAGKIPNFVEQISNTRSVSQRHLYFADFQHVHIVDLTCTGRGFTPIPRLDLSKSPWNSKVISIAEANIGDSYVLVCLQILIFFIKNQN